MATASKILLPPSEESFAVCCAQSSLFMPSKVLTYVTHSWIFLSLSSFFIASWTFDTSEDDSTPALSVSCELRLPGGSDRTGPAAWAVPPESSTATATATSAAGRASPTRNR